MGFFRGGSTVGGKRVATEDMFLEVIRSNEAADINSRLAKYTGTITTVTDFNNLSLDKKDNGVYDVQIANKITNDPLIINKKDGILFNLSTDIGKLQLFSTQENGGQAEFHINSGATGNNFQKIALQKDIDKKLNLTGGTLTGTLNSNSNISTSADITARRLDTTSGISANGDIMSKISGSGEGEIGFIDSHLNKSVYLYCNSNNAGFYDSGLGISPWYYSHDKILKSGMTDIILSTGTVWHSGNFNPNNYIPKDTPRYDSGADLNTLLTTGFYMANNALNRPSQLDNWIYIEVIRHNDGYVLQKVYSFYKPVGYFRVRQNNAWSEWAPLGGAGSYSKAVATGDWRDSDGDGAYETTVTHNLGMPNITSVILTDSNGYSMSTGFSTIDNNRLIVYCGTNPAGKIVVNATN